MLASNSAVLLLFFFSCLPSPTRPQAGGISENSAFAFTTSTHEQMMRTLEFIGTHIEKSALQKLMKSLSEINGEEKVKPRRNVEHPVNVFVTMELYQVTEMNERQQYITVSAWVIERWYDEFMYWKPGDHDNITTIRVPYTFMWIPDTTLYNTLVMKDDEQRRLLYLKLTTEPERRRAYVEFLYPAIYKFSCQLYLQYFPFDSQVYFEKSWTSDNHEIDYFAREPLIGTANYLQNEGWSLLGTSATRKEVKYVCCPNNYTLLNFTLFLRRRPLFYLVNLIVPTFIITLIAITGFFTTSSTTGVREEKISLCITTLLSMSILMLLVSEQMPSTSTFIPLISWFYMFAIGIISIGALAASFVITVQKFGRLGERLPFWIIRGARIFSSISLTRIPPHIDPNSTLDSETLFKLRRLAAHQNSNLSRKSTLKHFARYFFTAGSDLENNCASPTRNGGRRYSYSNSNGSTMRERECGGPVPAMDDGPFTATASATANHNSLFTERTREKIRKLNLTSTPSTESTKTLAVSAASLTLESVIMGCRSLRMTMLSRAVHNACDEIEEEKRFNAELARIEYDWLATVIERCIFLFFVLAFLVISIGINVVGFIHWVDSAPPPEYQPPDVEN